MNTNIEIRSKIDCACGAVKIAAALGLLLAAGAAYCDPPVSMAPPVQVQTTDDASGNVSADNVFNWTEVPQNQQVPIQRAVFDQGGYQLYDTQGETIVIPFTNQNLYVMKFALSNDGSTYFVNEDSAPVLYIPQDGYLENASVSGARWYPFSEKFHPSQPVFLGLAPSWHVFIGMGWYPDMCYYGGYWGETSFVSGGVFLPSVGLFFVIGGHHYYGWDHYHDYVFAHPSVYHVRVGNHYVYESHHSDLGGRTFRGGRTFASGHSFGNGRVFHGGQSVGSSHVLTGGHVFIGGNSAHAHRTFSSGRTFSNGRTFRGAVSTSGSHSFGTDHSVSSGHSFGSHEGSFPEGRSSGGRSVGDRSSGSHASGSHASGSAHSFGGRR